MRRLKNRDLCFNSNAKKRRGGGRDSAIQADHVQTRQEDPSKNVASVSLSLVCSQRPPFTISRMKIMHGTLLFRKEKVYLAAN